MTTEKQTKCVLVVDDEPDLRASLRRFLHRANFEVLEAGNGKEALEVFKNNKVDLVLTDLVMPGTDGVEAIMDLADSDPEVKIIAMSGGSAGNPKWLGAAKLLGAAVALTKPFEFQELLGQIENLLSEDEPPAA